MLDSLIQKGVEEGYLTYDPIPFVGNLNMYSPRGEELSIIKKDNIVREVMKKVDSNTLFRDTHVIVAPAQNIEDVVEVQVIRYIKMADKEYGAKTQWSLLIYNHADANYNHLMDFYGFPEDAREGLNQITDNWNNVVQKIFLEETISKLSVIKDIADNLDNVVRNMILKETISDINGQVIGTIKLSWD